jgi:hypothetical protein
MNASRNGIHLLPDTLRSLEIILMPQSPAEVLTIFEQAVELVRCGRIQNLVV